MAAAAGGGGRPSANDGRRICEIRGSGRAVERHTGRDTLGHALAYVDVRDRTGRDGGKAARHPAHRPRGRGIERIRHPATVHYGELTPAGELTAEDLGSVHLIGIGG